MNTKSALNLLKDRSFITKTEGYELAKIALGEYTLRSKAAKAVQVAVWNVAVASGCPNTILQTVQELFNQYSQKRG
jgi:hypothetical protein